MKKPVLSVTLFVLSLRPVTFACSLAVLLAAHAHAEEFSVAVEQLTAEHLEDEARDVKSPVLVPASFSSDGTDKGELETSSKAAHVAANSEPGTYVCGGSPPVNTGSDGTIYFEPANKPISKDSGLRILNNDYMDSEVIRSAKALGPDTVQLSGDFWRHWYGRWGYFDGGSPPKGRIQYHYDIVIKQVNGNIESMTVTQWPIGLDGKAIEGLPIEQQKSICADDLSRCKQPPTVPMKCHVYPGPL